MKKIFFSIVALAAIAACSKSEVAYEQPSEIGFKAVAGNITKTAVDGTNYPTSLNMFIYAETEDDELYIENGEFKHKGLYQDVTEDTQHDKNPNVWAGWDGSNWDPYYWPNTKKLHFAGYTKSGNVTDDDVDVDYDFTNETLTIEGYKPGNGVDNDLMFFPLTADYGKGDKYVPVNMYHTCAWITFLVKGDGVTGITGSTYSVNSLTITDIYETGDLTCTGTNVSWSYLEDDGTTPKYTKNAMAIVLEGTDEVELAGTYPNETTVNPVVAESNEGSTVLLPQIPGMLNLKYSYESPAGDTVVEEVELDLTLDTVVEDADNTDGVERTPWAAGKHYIYTITIKANEILIAPSIAVDWTDGNFNVTVE